MKDAFIKECSEMVTKHLEYKSWEEEIAHIPGVTFVSQEEANLFAITKIANLQTYKETSQSSQKPILKLKNHEPTDTQSDTFRIVRERSAGPNIYEAERTVFTPQDDGRLKKTVIKDVFAKVTTGNAPTKHQETKKCKNMKTKITQKGLREQAQRVQNILNHITAHNKVTQAIIVAKLVDKNGSEFASDVLKKSKEIQSGLKLSPFDTASMTLPWHYQIMQQSK